MGTKIQINSLEALERLIGNDNALELDLRNAIVQEFSKKYLKVLATELATSDVERAMRNVLKEQEIINVRTSTFGTKGRQIVNEKLELYFDHTLNDKIAEILNNSPLTEKLNQRLEEIVKSSLDRLSDESLTKRLDRMVDERLKTKLGITK